MAEQYFIRRNFADIFAFLESIRTQADSERNALGFLPETAYAEAAQQRKLILFLSQEEDRVLATTFDNLVALKKPVSFETLRRIGCVTRANFVSATPISDEHLAAIVDAGRIDE